MNIAEIRLSGQLAGTIFHDALGAFARLDTVEAAQIMREDEAIDEQYRALLRRLPAYNGRYDLLVLDLGLAGGLAGLAQRSSRPRRAAVPPLRSSFSEGGHQEMEFRPSLEIVPRQRSSVSHKWRKP